MDSRLLQAEGLLELERAEEALALAGRILAEDPGSHDASVVVIRALLRLRRYPEARAASQSLLGRHPDSEQAWRLDALAAARSGDFAAGWRSSRRAVELEPDEWRTHHVAAEVDLIANTPYADTWKHATQAVRLAPDESATHLLMGNVALHMGRLDAAESAYEEALRLDPQDDLARHNLGVAALRKGNDAKAARDLASALEVDPTDKITLDNLDIVVRRAFNQIQVWLLFAVVGSWGFSTLHFSEPKSQGEPARLVTLVGVVVAVAGAAVHLGRLARRAGPTFRRYLRSVPRRIPGFRLRFAMLTVAVCALLWAALGPGETASVGYGVAFLAVVFAVERTKWRHTR